MEEKRKKKNSVSLLILMVLLIYGTTFSFGKDQQPIGNLKVEENQFDQLQSKLKEGFLTNRVDISPTWEPNRLETSVESRSIYNYASGGILIGTLRSKCWWIHDENQVVRDFGVVFKESIPRDPDVIAHPPQSWQHYVGSNNGRVVIEAEYATVSGHYVIYQYYNLYGWGSYSVDYR